MYFPVLYDLLQYLHTLADEGNRLSVVRVPGALARLGYWNHIYLSEGRGNVPAP